MIVYGKNVAKEVISTKKEIKRVILSNNFDNKEILDGLKGIKIEYMNKRDMDYKYSSNNQGIIMEIEDYKYSDIKEVYDNHMIRTRETYKTISKLLEEVNITGEKNYEICRGISPMNYNTGLCIAFTVESFIALCNERLCVCSQEHIRKLVKMMRDEVVKLLPELENHLVAKCDTLLYCPESSKRSCGRHMQKDEMKLAIEQYLENKKI